MSLPRDSDPDYTASKVGTVRKFHDMSAGESHHVADRGQSYRSRNIAHPTWQVMSCKVAVAPPRPFRLGECTLPRLPLGLAPCRHMSSPRLPSYYCDT